jgi:hypothetical protein
MVLTEPALPWIAIGCIIDLVEDPRRPKLVPPAWRKKKVWTFSRRAMGNLIPLLFALPFLTVGGLMMWATQDFLGWGLAVFAGGPFAGWLAMNFLGLYQNRQIRHELEMRLRLDRERLPPRRFFVGVATPQHKGLLDPHEDVGFLILHSDRLEFFGDSLSLSLPREQITRIRCRPNMHSLVGLGRWVSVEGRAGDRPIRLDIELREKRTLLHNFRLSRSLLKRLQGWLKEEKPRR